MSADYDLIGSVAISNLIPTTNYAANINSANFDLSPYQGTVGVILSSGLGIGPSATLQVAIYDSADNSTFAVSNVSTNVFTNVTNVNSTQVLNLDTRSMRRYLRVVSNIPTVSTAFPFGVSLLGQKEYNPL